MVAPSSRMQVWKDILDEFEFLEEQLVYVDAPIEGFLRALKTGELFAFRCTQIVPGCLWHWVLLPASPSHVTVEAVFSAVRVAWPKEWISIVEDRRGEEPQLVVAWMRGDERPRES